MDFFVFGFYFLAIEKKNLHINLSLKNITDNKII